MHNIHPTTLLLAELQSQSKDEANEFLDPFKASLVERFNSQVVKRNRREADSMAEPDPQFSSPRLSTLSVKQSLESLSLEELLKLLESLGPSDASQFQNPNTAALTSQQSHHEKVSNLDRLPLGSTLTNSEFVEQLNFGAVNPQTSEPLEAIFPQTSADSVQINFKTPTHPPALIFMASQTPEQLKNISKTLSLRPPFNRTPLGGNIIESLTSLQQNSGLLDTGTFQSNNGDPVIKLSQLQLESLSKNLRENRNKQVSDHIFTDNSLNMEALNSKRQLGQEIVETKQANFVGGTLLDDPIVINSLSNRLNIINSIPISNFQPDAKIKIKQSDALAEVLRRIELLEKESGGALDQVLNPISVSSTFAPTIPVRSTSAPIGGTLHVSFPGDNFGFPGPRHQEQPEQFHEALHLTPSPAGFIPPHHPLTEPLNLNSHVPGPDPYSVPVPDAYSSIHHEIHSHDAAHELPSYKTDKNLLVDPKHDHHHTKAAPYSVHPDKIPPPTVVKVNFPLHI